MKNFVEEGASVSYANASGSTIASGAIVPMVTVCGVAMTDIADGSSGTVKLSGVFSVGKTTGEAWAIGTALYLVVATGKLTSTASTNIPFGTAFAAALSADTTGQARLR